MQMVDRLQNKSLKLHRKEEFYFVMHEPQMDYAAHRIPILDETYLCFKFFRLGCRPSSFLTIHTSRTQFRNDCCISIFIVRIDLVKP